MNLPKNFKGEKYIYLLMAVKLCQQSKNLVALVGDDNNYVGGQNYYRAFTLFKNTTDNEWVLQERKNGANFADYSKHYRVYLPDNNARPLIGELFEGNDNLSKNWVH
jgi:Mor family transcriptional regulator